MRLKKNCNHVYCYRGPNLDLVKMSSLVSDDWSALRDLVFTRSRSLQTCQLHCSISSQLDQCQKGIQSHSSKLPVPDCQGQEILKHFEFVHHAGYIYILYMGREDVL